MKKRNGQVYPGVLARLHQQRVFKRARTDSLRGFWRSPTRRGVFRPLQVR